MLVTKTKNITEQVLKNWGLHEDLKKVIRNNKVNIYMTPEHIISAGTDGRHVYFTYGAIASWPKPQLRAVLAHELGHITKGHVGKEKLIVMGGLLTGGLAAAATGTGVLYPAIGTAAGDLVRRIYATYRAEPQADEEAAKYYPKETIEALKKIGKKSGLGSRRSTRPSKLHERALNYALSTLGEHPPIWARIRRIKAQQQLQSSTK
jgi:Zn-dependent protease with chaperone function